MEALLYDAERLVYIRNEAAGPEAGRVLLAERRAPERAAGGSPFAALGAFADGGGNLRLADSARAVNCSALVTPGLLELLGTEPARGRLFTADDYAAGDAAILSHRLWRDAYGGDPRRSSASNTRAIRRSTARPSTPSVIRGCKRTSTSTRVSIAGTFLDTLSPDLPTQPPVA